MLGKLLPFGYRNALTFADKKQERAQSTTLQDPAPWLMNAFGFKTTSGILLTPSNALTLSAVYGAVNAISSDISVLPCGIYKTNSDKTRTYLPKHPANLLLRANANLKQTVLADALMNGNGICRIIRNGSGKPIKLIYHPSQMVVPYVSESGKMFYRLNPWNGFNGGDFWEDEIFHIRGFSRNPYWGESVIAFGAENMGLGVAGQVFSGAFYSNGVNSDIAITYPGTMSEELRLKTAASLRDKYSGSEQSHTPLILQGGATVTPISQDAVKSQLLESRRFNVEDVGRWFRIPLSKIGELTQSANHNSMEQEAISYVQDCLLPWIIRFEQEVETKLFREDEKGEVIVELDTDGRLRGDSAAQATMFKALIETGAASPNDIALMKNLEPTKDESGWERYISQNLKPLKQALQPQEQAA